MKPRSLGRIGMVMMGAALLAGAGAAEPLTDLQARLAALHSEQPIRLKVEVEVWHEGSAPLHRSGASQRGKAVVVYGRRGPQVRQQSWSTRSGRLSVWTDDEVEMPPPLENDDAGFLVDPAGTLALLLRDATLVSDEAVDWRGQPARLLVVRPTYFPGHQGGPASRLAGEAKIWLNESGSPLALEHSTEFRLGSALNATKHQTLTFQEVGGRLLAADAEETYSGTALAMLHGWDGKRMRVTVDR